MKVGIQWLKDYVEIDVSPEILAHKLTMAGMEIEKSEKIKGDTVFELEITPNRPDCLNVIGLAREVSAILDKTLKTPKTKKQVFPNDACDISILDKEGCWRYIGITINNVEVTKTPGWMLDKIEAVGLRSINNIVDITNFCLLETGQPLHAFDYDKLIGNKIIVRRAKQGEKIVTLDDVERELDPSMLVIADAERPVAIAGVMGGKDTEVTEKTKNILLESAYFDPILIRRTSRALGLSSDSSYRFERGVDIKMVEGGSDRAFSLIKELAGGQVSQRTDLFVKKRKEIRTKITVKKEQIDSLLGASIPVSKSKTILKKLEFDVEIEDKNKLKVIPPSFRNDIKQNVDVIEEIARVIGYDNLPESLPKIAATNIQKSDTLRIKKELRKLLIAQGLSEAITYSLTSLKNLEMSHLEELSSIRVINPLSKDQEMMRPAVLPSLLSVLRSNFNRRQKDIHVFELGKIYPSSGEKEVLSVIMTGSRHKDWRILKKEDVDFYDIKGVVDSVLARYYNRQVIYKKEDNKIFSPGQSAVIESKKAGNKKIGIIGKVSKKIINEWDLISENIFFAQIDINSLESTQVVNYEAVSEYPAITRDISLSVKKDISYEQIKKVVFNQKAKFLTEVNFLEQYMGEKIPAGQRGIIFSLLYQSDKKTLTEAEINESHKQICQALVDDLEAVIR